MAANVTIASQQEKLEEKGTKIISLARRVVDLERRVSELEEHPAMDGKKCYWKHYQHFVLQNEIAKHPLTKNCQ